MCHFSNYIIDINYMRRSTKIKIGVAVFILLCLIIGLTLYFVLRKKPSSSSEPSPHGTQSLKGSLLSSSSSTPYSRYQESKHELKILYQENQELNTKLMSTVKVLEDIYNSNKPIVIDSDKYIKLYNEMESKMIVIIKNINDIYTFIGDYDNSSFSGNKTVFQTQIVPHFMTKTQQFRKMVNQKGLSPHDYTYNVFAAFSQLQSFVGDIFHAILYTLVNN